MMTPRQIAETAVCAYKANQRVAELTELVRIVQTLAPIRVLEIGSQDGGTLWCWAQAAWDTARLVSVDLPDPNYQQIELQAYTRGLQTCELIRADSTDPETAHRAFKALGGEAEFIFIDADHSYESVSKDWNNYLPLLAPGGMIALHDIACCSGVTQLWEELKPYYAHHQEIIATDDEFGPCGIGVIFS